MTRQHSHHEKSYTPLKNDNVAYKKHQVLLVPNVPVDNVQQ